MNNIIVLIICLRLSCADGFLFGLLSSLTGPACPTKTTYPSHIVRNFHKCYEFINSYHVDWVHAQTDCRSKGGNLVTIETRSEQNFILNEIQKRGYHGKGLWIGLNDRNNEGTFSWISGKYSSFTYWAAGQPDDNMQLNDQDCVLLYIPNHYTRDKYGHLYPVYDGQPGWHDQICQNSLIVTENNGWICEYDGLNNFNQTTNSPQVPSIPGNSSNPPHLSGNGCPLHSDHFAYYKIRDDKCYEFILSHKTDWHHAQLDCHSKGGFLVTIENSKEEEYLANDLQVMLYSGKGVWIGLNDKQVDGKYVWDSGKPTTYMNWEPGQPNDKDYIQDQDCVLMLTPTDPPNFVKYTNGTKQLVYHNTPGWRDQVCQNMIQNESDGWICEYYITQSVQMSTTHKPVTDSKLMHTSESKNTQGPSSDTTISQSHTTTVTKQVTNNNNASLSSTNTVYNTGTWQVTTPSQTTAYPTSSCSSHTTYPGNCTILGTKCYEYILSHSTNWVLAREDCHKKGGYLVTIENIQEENLLTHYIQSTQYSGKGVWIGLNDLQQEGQFVWDSGKMAGFRHWLPGHPDNNTILQQLQDCILLYLPYDKTTLTSPGWGDQICTYDNGWICEYYLDPPTTLTT